MLEKQLRKQIILTISFVVTITFILFAVATIMFQKTTHAQMQEAQNELLYTTDLHKNMLDKQVSGDLQTLITLATFMETTDLFHSDSLIEQLKKTNEENNFIRMGYVRNGVGRFVNLQGATMEQRDLDNDPLIQKALAGQNAVSSIYWDDWHQQNVIRYAVPVYKDKSVAGVLTATHDAAVLSPVVSDDVFNGWGRVHIIDNQGNFVLRSDDFIIDEDIHNIFDGGYLSAEDREAAMNSLAIGEKAFFTITYQHVSYALSFQPVEINEWFIFCVVPESVLAGDFGSVGNMIPLIFAIILFMVIIVSIYIYRMTVNHNRSIIKLAYFDTLTGAYNWNRFKMLANERLATHVPYAVVALNIEKFKFINELYGHQTGDKLLMHIRKVCDERIRENELFCRQTGDQFLLLLKADKQEILYDRIQQIFSSIARFPGIKKQNYQIHCSCGVKYADENDTNIDLQISRLNLALQAAKGKHENTIVFYDKNMHEKAEMRNRIESNMDSALVNHQFIMMLQPKFLLQNGRLHSAEALVRWISDDGSMIYPDQFIPLFEENGFCVKLDMYMLDKACSQLRLWIDSGYPVVPIAVNQSRLVFYQENYAEQVQKILEAYQIPPDMIILEITENLAMDNLDEIQTILMKLHQIGIRISMDDFGSGYSSLNTLKELDIDELKLDRMFLRETEPSIYPRRNSILKNIVQLAKDLAITTVMEGIETGEQEAFVKNLQCDIGQGYHFARPMDIQSFEQYYYR